VDERFVSNESNHLNNVRTGCGLQGYFAISELLRRTFTVRQAAAELGESTLSDLGGESISPGPARVGRPAFAASSHLHEEMSLFVRSHCVTYFRSSVDNFQNVSGENAFNAGPSSSVSQYRK
jgi:hypothetical protein